MKYKLFILSVALAFVCCGNRNKNSADEQATRGPRPFSIPEIPVVMTDNEDKALYILDHYWDNFDFTDTLYVGSEILEQAFADFVYIANSSPSGPATAAMAKMMRKARVEPALYRYFMEITDKYLYDPNAPMRNEELYIPILEDIESYEGIEDIEKIRPGVQKNMAMKNRPGQVAADIVVTLSSGRTANLHGVDTPFTLLYINNPDCSACRQIKVQYAGFGLLQALVEEGTLTVFAVYPDEELEIWREHLPETPELWINGYDAGRVMTEQQTYDLKAIPTLYLLGSDKRVLIKDAADLSPIEEFFAGIFGMH